MARLLTLDVVGIVVLAGQMVDQLVRVESVVLVATVNALASAEERLSDLAELIDFGVYLDQIVLQKAFAGHRCRCRHVGAPGRIGRRREDETRKADLVGE